MIQSNAYLLSRRAELTFSAELFNVKKFMNEASQPTNPKQIVRPPFPFQRRQQHLPYARHKSRAQGTLEFRN